MGTLCCAMNPTPTNQFTKPLTTMNTNRTLLFRSFIVVTMSFLLTHIQAAWVQHADFPGQRRMYAICFAIGNKIYYGGGSGFDQNGQYFEADDFWMFDTGTDTWTQKASFPNGGIQQCASFTIGTKGYVATGLLPESNETNNIWEYDPGTDAWTMKAPMPGNSRHGATGFSVGAYGYVAGGTDGVFPTTPLSEVWRYDPATNSWLQMNPSGITGGQGLYFMIGSDAYIGATGQFWKYTAATDTWLQRNNLPSGITGTSFGYAGAGYIVGSAQSYTYSSATDSWSSVTGPPSTAGWDRGVTVGNSAYLIAGTDASVWELTGNTGVEVDASARTISLFPNPTTGLFTLQLPANEQVRRISVLDAAGRTVEEKTVTHTTGSITMNLNGQERGSFVVDLLLLDGTRATLPLMKE